MGNFHTQVRRQGDNNNTIRARSRLREKEYKTITSNTSTETIDWNMSKVHYIEQFVIGIAILVEEFVLFKERMRIKQISTQIGYSRQQKLKQ